MNANKKPPEKQTPTATTNHAAASLAHPEHDCKTSGFVKMPVDLLARRDLTPAAKIVAAVALDRQRRGKPCSLTGLERACGMTRHAMIRAKRRLLAVGLWPGVETTLGGSVETTLGVVSKRHQQLVSKRHHISEYKNRASTACAVEGTERTRSRMCEGSVATLPPGLDTPDFRRAWSDWCRYRKEARHPLKPMTAERQLRMLAEHGPAAAVAMIEQSLTHGWRGLFPLKDPAGNNGQRQVQREADIPDYLRRELS